MVIMRLNYWLRFDFEQAQQFASKLSNITQIERDKQITKEAFIQIAENQEGHFTSVVFQELA
jgi:GMP synthase PP-ATPase subunit